MEQIAYRVHGIEDFFKAFKLITSEACIRQGDFFGLQADSNFRFRLNYTESILHGTAQNRKFFWFEVYDFTDRTEEETSDENLLFPYFIDYDSPNSSEVGRTYIGKKSGTFKLLNVLYVDEDEDDDFYIFFSANHLSIVKCGDDGVAKYLIIGGGIYESSPDIQWAYILSSESAIVDKDSGEIYEKIYSSNNLLCYRTRFFTEDLPSYLSDYIDTTYCSIHYDELTRYSQEIRIDKDTTISVDYTFDKKWYARCTCSLLFDSYDTNVLPVYNNLVKYLDNAGSPAMSNTLNGISLLLPNYFFIDTAPLTTHKYKYIFDTPEMCYCSMYNMSSERVVQQNFPTKGNKFMCFSLSSNDEKQKKENNYLGIAFMLPIRYESMVVDSGKADIIKL